MGFVKALFLLIVNNNTEFQKINKIKSEAKHTE